MISECLCLFLFFKVSEFQRLFFQTKVCLLPCAQLESRAGDFPGGSVVGTSSSNAGGAGSVHSQGARILHALLPKNPKI